MASRRRGTRTQGVFDYLIATDESLGGEEEEGVAEGDAGGAVEGDGGGGGVGDGSASGEGRGDGAGGNEEGTVPRAKRARHAAADAEAAGGGGGAAVPAARGKSVKRDASFGVSRGVDFRGVGTVINVDLPATVTAYTHRIGRTARAGAHGAALSFVETGNADHATLLAGLQAFQLPAADGA